MKLFAAYVGGKTANSNIELHDMRFSVGEAIEDCYEDLRKQWWGTPESLHLDCWGALEHADGYEVSLSSQPYAGKEKLYFLNLGAYDAAQFTELHHNVFVVAETESKAKVKALKQIIDWQARHMDNQIEIESAVCLNPLIEGRNLHIHLTQTDKGKPFEFICKYTPIALGKTQR